MVPRAALGDVEVTLDSPVRARRIRKSQPLTGRLLDASFTGVRIAADHDHRLVPGSRVQIAVGLATARGILWRVTPAERGESDGRTQYGIELDSFDDQFRHLMEGWAISDRMVDESLWNSAL